MAYTPKHYYAPEHLNEGTEQTAAKKSKPHIFGISLLILFTILMALSVYAWGVLWEFLESYEKNHISHAAEQFMDKYRLNCIEEILDEKSPQYDRFNGREQYLQYMKEVFGEDYTGAKSVKGRTFDDGSVNYTVYLDNLKFAEYTLSPDGNNDKFGLHGWVCTAEDMNGELFPKTKGFKICVPAGSQVYANGQLLGEENISQESYTVHDYDDLDDKSLIPQFVIYSGSEMFLCEPEITAADKNGGQMRLEEEKGTLYAYYQPTEEKLAEVKEFCETASVAYAKYITKDAPFSEAEQYIESESEFMRRLKNFWHDWYRDHTVTYDNVEFSDIIFYDEDHAVMTIDFDYHVNIGYKIIDYDVNYRVSLINTEEGWKIATMIM